MRSQLSIALLLATSVCACGDELPPPRSPEQRTGDSAPALRSLQDARFEDAARHASAALTLDPRNAQAAAVRAIAGYQRAGHDLIHELGAIIEQADDLKFFDHQAGRAAWQTFVDRLDAVDRDLAVVAADPTFALELCIACWEHDWNRNGEIDDRDRRLMEIEYDGLGGEIPEGDPRRRPSFRFDVGDASWARAMLAYQRAGVELILAYRWSQLDLLLRGGGRGEPRMVIPLLDAARVKRARAHILAGADHADRCREAYLAETDDDREWVPNPRQKNHPIPLAVDAELYATWAAITGDLRHLVSSREGLSIRELAALVDDDLGRLAPDAYIDLGKLLGEPKELVIDLRDLSEKPAAVERLLRGLLGNGFQQSMKPSPLPARLRGMKQQLDRGEDTAEHKLRYLLWLN
jgi:hypothetical protein